MTTSSTTTRERLQRCAVTLFEAHGYAETSVAAIAHEAGVSHMTFFRHFPSKGDVVVGDLFDPVIAAAVASQPTQLPALERAVRGLVSAMQHEEATAEMRSAQFRRRLRLITSTPELRSALWRSGQASQDAISEALGTPGTSALAARTAAGAVMGAATAVLIHWGTEPDRTFADQALRESLLSLLQDAG
ncbi:MAG: TetR/AcrR family transcriptional regulator [Brachybacterium tyrofermentans]|uniref:TetR/AcrR family transcriptional regulator n=1 Tax=Brachybacterium tyrofermentans TaxID=47848 RepID=UPI00186765E6|nr:TetR/AcrR family transcriptional regulator [Brachybacterium tyrofermentans]